MCKALRRQSRAQGHQTTAPGRGTVIPGRNAKALWKSLTHKERGQWRSKLPITRASARRKAQCDALAYFIAQLRDFPASYRQDAVDVLATGRTSYANARAMLPRSR